MKIPQTFLTKRENIERKIKELMERDDEERRYFGKDDGFFADDLLLLETLKKGKTREEQEAFLKLLAKHIPGLVRRIRTEMEQTDKKRIYLDNPEDYKNRGYGYRTSLEIGMNGHLRFYHSVSGNTYMADLDDDYYKDCWPIHEYLNTYLDKKKQIQCSSYFLDASFKKGKEIYDSIVLFLRENKNL